jgi:hypothetical protein
MIGQKLARRRARLAARRKHPVWPFGPCAVCGRRAVAEMASYHGDGDALYIAALCPGHLDPAVGSLWCPLCREATEVLGHGTPRWVH